MQRLSRGSVILFGSHVKGRFVLDTVFVIERRIGTFVPTAKMEFEFDPAFRICTLESLATWPPEFSNASFTLYRGASLEQPVASMFSFVPCNPFDGDGPRFARPTVEIPRIVNPAMKMGVRGTGVSRDLSHIAAIWRHVKSQVLAQDLSLATLIRTPSISSGTRDGRCKRVVRKWRELANTLLWQRYSVGEDWRFSFRRERLSTT